MSVAAAMLQADGARARTSMRSQDQRYCTVLVKEKWASRRCAARRVWGGEDIEMGLQSHPFIAADATTLCALIYSHIREGLDLKGRSEFQQMPTTQGHKAARAYRRGENGDPQWGQIRTDVAAAIRHSQVLPFGWAG